MPQFLQKYKAATIASIITVLVIVFNTYIRNFNTWNERGPLDYFVALYFCQMLAIIIPVVLSKGFDKIVAYGAGMVILQNFIDSRLFVYDEIDNNEIAAAVIIPVICYIIWRKTGKPKPRITANVLLLITIAAVSTIGRNPVFAAYLPFTFVDDMMFFVFDAFFFYLLAMYSVNNTTGTGLILAIGYLGLTSNSLVSDVFQIDQYKFSWQNFWVAVYIAYHVVRALLKRINAGNVTMLRVLDIINYAIHFLILAILLYKMYLLYI